MFQIDAHMMDFEDNVDLFLLTKQLVVCSLISSLLADLSEHHRYLNLTVTREAWGTSESLGNHDKLFIRIDYFGMSSNKHLTGEAALMEVL